MKKEGWLIWSFILLLSSGRTVPAEEASPFLTLNTAQFNHEVGKDSRSGWELNYHRDKPGYPFLTLHKPLLLDYGTYRFTFLTRRGAFPRKSWLQAAMPVFRLELWDQTANELINQRELQWDDYSEPNKIEPRWIEMSFYGRKGHFIEPKIFWYGLCNAEAVRIEISKFPEVSTETLQLKAAHLSQELREHQLENGFVVSRKPTGEADEIGDATTYTGYYAAALAWEYGVTQDPVTLATLEATMQKLHLTLKGSSEQPILTRFVNEEGVPYPNSPSKDVYTSYFLAHAVAYPFIRNPAIKSQMKTDLRRITAGLVEQDWSIKAGATEAVSLAPYLTTDEVRSGIHKLINDKNETKKFLKALKLAKKLAPFGELWPGMKKVIKALKEKDEQGLLLMVVPTINGMLQISERVISLLQEKYRDDLLPRRTTNPHHPGKRLESLLQKGLQKIRSGTAAGTIMNLSDVQVLAGNALIDLHILRTAAFITKDPQLISAENKNFFQRAALLTCVVNWYGFEEDLFITVAGNPAADQERRGYLSILALYNLINLEKNSERKKVYQDILDRWWTYNQNDDNPLSHAFYLACSNGRGGDVGLILKALSEYPEDRVGFGEEYWKDHGTEIAQTFGGGNNHGSTREPLPISLRPKDSFLWQRNSRRLSGDRKNTYPSTDFLFVYWFCRYNELF